MTSSSNLKKMQDATNVSRAESATRDAQKILAQTSRLLDLSLLYTKEFDWEQHKNHSSFSKEKPKIGVLDQLLGRTEQKQEQIAKWETEQERFLRSIKKENKKVDALRRSFEEGESEAVQFYASRILSMSVYPGNLSTEWLLEFEQETGLIRVSCLLPSAATLPKTQEVKYVKSTGQYKIKELSQKQQNELYETVLYQLSLSTIYELFRYVMPVTSVAFNGFVKSIDPRTGQQIQPCIISVVTSRETFEELNLSRVDPKECFRHVGGVCASKLHTVTPIAPLATTPTDDSRFVEPYAVVQEIDASTNLAAMDWVDFENLIRELFESEFAVAGGEVKITQASRDRGVDAIAFDPDPVRGGKVVIQAKRYTNVVDVSAVRDLYGTVLNEGAMKGILVTTSTYGRDAYEFAKNKPLTLLTGNNLLHLLEKHGHRARIDISEARIASNSKIRERRKK